MYGSVQPGPFPGGARSAEEGRAGGRRPPRARPASPHPACPGRWPALLTSARCPQPRPGEGLGRPQCGRRGLTGPQAGSAQATEALWPQEGPLRSPLPQAAPGPRPGVGAHILCGCTGPPGPHQRVCSSWGERRPAFLPGQTSRARASRGPRETMGTPRVG